jgi:4-amino-4-deoxy-L-arabinose transferase-like glycosyltransferase
MFRRAKPLLWIGGIAGLLWLIVPFGFLSYDTWYSVVWGEEIAHGHSPDYGAGQPPTPHPLGVLWSALISPLGATGASDATLVLAYLALASVAYAVYRLGSLWFNRGVGLIAGAIVLTRPAFLLYGLRAYPDLVYIALVLGALVLETRRPRAGAPVLIILALAGLIRPEAWLFSAVYIAYLALERDPGGGRLALRRRSGLEGGAMARLVALAASAPLLWVAFDLITTGNPTYSFTETHNRVESLERKTGPLNLIRFGPHQLGIVIGWPLAVGAAAGIALSLLLLSRRATGAIVALLLAAGAFVFLATAGFSIIDRYTMLTSTILCIFCALALVGWSLMSRSHPWRRRWLVVGALVAAGFLAQASSEYHFLSEARAELDEQQGLEADLHRVLESGAVGERCRPLSVPSDRAVPRLAAWLGIRPSEIVITDEQPKEPTHGYIFQPASPAARLHYSSTPIPPGFRPLYRNESWVLYGRCG